MPAFDQHLLRSLTMAKSEAGHARFSCNVLATAVWWLHSAGALLKESIEDLEWTAIGSSSSSVEVCMQRQPRRLSFTAQAAGSLQVRL